MANPAIAKEDVFKLAKVAGVLAVMCTSLTHEYGVTINFVTTQSLGVYPAAQFLVPFAMLFAGLVMLPKTYLYMEFSRALPRAGSFYVWISRTLGLPVGFVASFLFWISLAAAGGTVAYAVPTFAADALVAAGLPGAKMITGVAGHLVIGLGVVWAAFAIHVAGVRWFGRLVIVLSVLIGLSALTIVVFGFATPPAQFLELARAASSQALTPPSHTSPPSIPAFLAVTGLLIAAYGGLSGGAALGGEARDAGRTTARGTFLGWASSFILYTVVAFAIFHAVPWWSVTQLIAGKNDTLATAPGLIGMTAPRWISIALNAITAVVVAKTLLPQMLVCSRTAFAFAQDGIFPTVFEGTTSGTKAPLPALLLTAVLASLSLVQATLIGWQIGFVFRSVAILLILFFIGVGIFSTRLNPRVRGQDWARQLARNPILIICAGVGIILACVLAVSVVNVPDTPIVFQPWLQFIVGAAVGAVIYWIASLKRGSRELGRRADTVPVE